MSIWYEEQEDSIEAPISEVEPHDFQEYYEAYLDRRPKPKWKKEWEAYSKAEGFDKLLDKSNSRV